MSPFLSLRRTAQRWQGRRTVRFRLTLLIAGLLLVVGIALLAITYLLVEHSNGVAVISTNGNSKGKHVIVKGSAPHLQSGVNKGTGHLSPQELHQAKQFYAQALLQRNADLHHLLTQSGIALAVMAVVAVAIGWFVAGRLLRPLRTMTAATRRISAHNLHERLALDGPHDEMTALAETIDDLLARLEGAFDAQRHFVANASHELRTPITLDRTLLEVALANHHATAATLRATCQELLESTQDKEKLIDALLALASSESGLDHRERLDLSVICDNQLLRSDLDTDRLGLQVATTIRSAPLDGDPRLVERLVANLLENAIHHNSPGGHLDITTAIEKGSAVLCVANTGPVIPPDQLDRLFEPFQRLDPARAYHDNGHGLGLSIVRAIADAHGATIQASAPPEGGLTVKVAFPRPATTASPLDGSPRVRPAPGAHRVDEQARPSSVTST
jgi:signal transduction histidine kinase